MNRLGFMMGIFTLVVLGAMPGAGSHRAEAAAATYSSVSGRVFHPSGAAVKNAKIKLIVVMNGKAAYASGSWSTNEDGSYTIPRLASGRTYCIEASTYVPPTYGLDGQVVYPARMFYGHSMAFVIPNGGAPRYVLNIYNFGK